MNGIVYNRLIRQRGHDGVRRRSASFLTLLIIPFLSLAAQTYEIDWMGQFPDPDRSGKAPFGERLSHLLLGKSPFKLVRPFNVVAEDSSHYWILDQGSGKIAEILEGEGSFLRETGRTHPGFPSMVGICRLPGGGILCTDSRLNKVYIIFGSELRPLDDSLVLEQPTGIAWCDVTGEIWLVETAAHRITLLNSEGEFLRRIGARGSGPGEFNFPTFIWIDAAGKVYIVDSMNFRVQVLDHEGNFLFCFGESGDGTGNMARPKGVATDSRGNIYVADALFHAVQVFSSQGELLYSFGKQGRGVGEFWMPSGIYIDAGDRIYVADSYNARIQFFNLVKN